MYAPIRDFLAYSAYLRARYTTVKRGGCGSAEVQFASTTLVSSRVLSILKRYKAHTQTNKKRSVYINFYNNAAARSVVHQKHNSQPPR